MKINRKKAIGLNLVICIATLGVLTGCVASVDGPRGDYGQPPSVQVDAGFAVQDDYVYYPGYQVYYSSSRHQYAYLERGAWVSRPAPRGVSAKVLLASPAVRMDFHDSPANHHATVARQYPKNWAPAGAKHGNPEAQRNDNKEGR